MTDSLYVSFLKKINQFIPESWNRITFDLKKTRMTNKEHLKEFSLYILGGVLMMLLAGSYAQLISYLNLLAIPEFEIKYPFWSFWPLTMIFLMFYNFSN